MSWDWRGFAIETLMLGADPLAFLVAFALALLVRGRLDALLIVINFWLLTELLATLVGSGYGFGDLALARLVACALQIAVAWGAIRAWRRWRFETGSVAAN